MVKKKDNSVPEPKKTPELEEILEEGEKEREEADKKAAEEAKAKEEAEKNPPEEVDIDKFKEETKKEVEDKITTEVITPLQEQIAKLAEAGKDKQEKSEIAKGLEALEAKAKAENRDLTYAEALEFVTTHATETALNKIKEEQKAEKEAQEAKEAEEKKAKTEQEEANFKYWQGQLQEMEDKGLLPKMEKPQAGDKGFDARLKLYGFMQGTWKGDAPLTNLYEVYTKFYKEENKQPAGGDAPVSMGQQAAGGKDDEQLKYSEVHKGGQDLETFLFELMKKGTN